MSNEQENPLVSVVIPTYKRPDMLGRAIDSVLNQTYDNIEIIVVDDNDEDSEYRKETEEFMEKYSKVYNLVYLKHKNNKNGAAARNTGIRKAKGEYIAFLDDDDEFLSRKIQLQIKKISTASKDFGAVYCNYSYYHNNKLISVINDNKKGNLKKELLLNEIPIAAGSTLLIRKEIINKYLKGFDEKFDRHQDWEFMLRFFRNHKILLINENLVKVHKDSIINKPNPDQLLQSKKQYLTKFKNDIKKFEITIQNQIYKKHYLEIAKLYCNNKEYRKTFDTLNIIKEYTKLNPKVS